MKHAIEVSYADGGHVTYYATDRQKADDFAERVMESGPAALSVLVRPAKKGELDKSVDEPSTGDSQNEQVLSYMRKNGSISTWEAIQEFGCTRLAARIGNLRAKGYTIDVSRAKRDGKSWAVYRLKE